jgi:hypothetical protein
MLLLKKHLVDLVRAGRKRQTIRFWTRPIVFPGQISFTPGLGKMKILRVEELAGYEALTPGDAHDDGFDTLEELLAELKRNYPEVPAGKRLYRVVFQWPLDVPTAEMGLRKQTAQRPVAALQAGTTTSPAVRLVPDRPIPGQTRRRAGAAIKAAADEKSGPTLQEAMSTPQRELLRKWVVAHQPDNDRSL